jgi:hypothetical protein
MMPLVNQLNDELKELKFTRTLDIVERNTGKDAGDFGGLRGLLEHCLNNGFNEEADLLKQTQGNSQ